MQNGSSFQNSVATKIDSVLLTLGKFTEINPPPKFEMSGYVQSNVLSKEHDNKVHSIMEGPINSCF